MSCFNFTMLSFLLLSAFAHYLHLCDSGKASEKSSAPSESSSGLSLLDPAHGSTINLDWNSKTQLLASYPFNILPEFGLTEKPY